jgi:hypothetical protein
MRLGKPHNLRSRRMPHDAVDPADCELLIGDSARHRVRWRAPRRAEYTLHLGQRLEPRRVLRSVLPQRLAQLSRAR